MELLLVISAAAAARCHDKREQLPNDCACMLHVHTLTQYVGLGCQKGGLAKTGLAGPVLLSQSCDRERDFSAPSSHIHIATMDRLQHWVQKRLGGNC